MQSVISRERGGSGGQDGGCCNGVVRTSAAFKYGVVVFCKQGGRREGRAGPGFFGAAAAGRGHLLGAAELARGARSVDKHSS